MVMNAKSWVYMTVAVQVHMYCLLRFGGKLVEIKYNIYYLLHSEM